MGGPQDPQVFIPFKCQVGGRGFTRNIEHLGGREEPRAPRYPQVSDITDQGVPGVVRSPRNYWVAVKELKSSYYIGETLLFTIYTHYGNLI